MQELRKYVNNYPIPWLSLIASGFKTYEGRTAIKIQEWNLEVGKRITFFCNDIEVNVLVTSLKQYGSFGDAFDDLGNALVPIPNSTRAGVERLYREYYTDEEVAKYGVVAIGVQVLGLRAIQ